ncbi:hypothetical protein [Winogradskya humida]|uniref:hypothetical protein n=1 Tax=Winogradskya humida TaxID=113566 RepID=UPI001943B423|nr:hypothetical protein [Actinoplanes humidus]
MTAPRDRELYIGADHEKTVVSAYPLKMRTGRARRYRFGSVTEVVPRTPSGRSREQRIKVSSELALVLLVVCAVLTLVDVPWLVAASGSLALVAFVTARQARAAKVGTLALPREEGAFVLHAEQERAAFGRAVASARRVRRTWPALRHMVDAAEADRSLTAALGELAATLSRRQQIRRLRDELYDAAGHGLPGESPAAMALAEQRTRVEELWQVSGADANRILASIHAAAVAGENLIHEQRVHETAREAELAISRLTATGTPTTNAGPELAERTAAVIAAYRELAAAN